jgi:hypothetical protein
MTLSTQLGAVAQSAISALESKVTFLKSLLNDPIHISRRFLVIFHDGFLFNNRLFTADHP